MSPEFYRVLHLFGIFLLFCTLGGLTMLAWQTRGAQAVKEEVTAARKRLVMVHGLALIVILVAGFGLMAKLGMMKGWPTWIYGKLAIWVVLGAAATAVRKLADHGKLWIVLLPVFGAVAAYLAILHPG